MTGVQTCALPILLVRESRGLLIGEGIRPATARDIRRMVRGHAPVLGVSGPLSMYIGRAEVLVTMDVEFADGTPAEVVASTIVAIEQEVRARYPVIRRIYIEARKLAAQGQQDRQLAPAQ